MKYFHIIYDFLSINLLIWSRFKIKMKIINQIHKTMQLGILIATKTVRSLHNVILCCALDFRFRLWRWQHLTFLMHMNNNIIPNYDEVDEKLIEYSSWLGNPLPCSAWCFWKKFFSTNRNRWFLDINYIFIEFNCFHRVYSSSLHFI